MSISTLILTLALSNIQYEVIAQQPVFMKDRPVSREPGGVMLASGGNPWAMPVPDEDYPQGSRQDLQRQPSTQANRPRYVTPEELESLEHMPDEQRAYGSYRVPRDKQRLLEGRRYAAPMYRAPGYGGTRYNGPGGYPSNGIYGYPSYPVSPLVDPYGGSPYGNMPVEELLPFMY